MNDYFRAGFEKVAISKIIPIAKRLENLQLRYAERLAQKGMSQAKALDKALDVEDVATLESKLRMANPLKLKASKGFNTGSAGGMVNPFEKAAKNMGAFADKARKFFSGSASLEAKRNTLNKMKSMAAKKKAQGNVLDYGAMKKEFKAKNMPKRVEDPAKGFSAHAKYRLSKTAPKGMYAREGIGGVKPKTVIAPVKRPDTF